MTRAAAARARIGFRAHTGWAALVVVAGPPGAPVVVERRTIEMIIADAAAQSCARELMARAAALFGVAAAKVPERLAEIGRAAGRPWARDQKDALVAALAARP